MRRRSILVLLSFASFAAPATAEPADPIVAHEWGTFVAMQGSDGVLLEGLHHETERLPDFVHSATVESNSPFRAYGDTTLQAPARHVNGKGETPVIYFYSRRPHHLRVHVEFPRGLLTQWYPRASGPTFAALSLAPLDLAVAQHSALDWQLDLIPPGDGAGLALPAVPPDALWAMARVPGADYVRSGGETERYVFYRGLGHMDSPARVVAQGDFVTVSNTTRERIPAAFLVEMTPWSGSFAPLGPLGPGGSVKARHPAAGERELSIAALESAMTRALTAAGLYPDEARAMVRTWSSAWFGSPGRRVIYLLPRAVTDELLPLTITPAPSRLERVLVGRLEFQTPEEEARVQELLRDRVSIDEPIRQYGMRGLAQLGRFLEPSVRRAIQLSTDETVRTSGGEVLAAFRKAN